MEIAKKILLLFIGRRYSFIDIFFFSFYIAFVLTLGRTWGLVISCAVAFVFLITVESYMRGFLDDK